VAVKAQGQVVRIDARNGRVTARLTPGAPPSRLTTGLGSVWVTTLFPLPQPIRYSTSGRELSRARLPIPASAVVTGAGFVWVTLEEDPRLLRLDPRTSNSVVWAKLAAPGTALSYGAGFVWATLNSIDSIAQISPRRTGAVTTAVGRSPAQTVAAGGHVFVAINTEHLVRLVNPRTSRLEDPPVPVELNPFALVADDRAVWVTGLGNNTVSRIAYR